MLSIALLVFAQASSSATAWPSARPLECGGLDGDRAANVWERAKAPMLRKYCDLLASGASKLAGNGSFPRDVLAIADEAEQAMPGHAGPCVLRGRALARLGKNDDAFAAFTLAKSRDPRALDEPTALLAWARVLARKGESVAASEAYRALLPRASTLTLADRGAAGLEAGLLAMNRGANGIEEAIAIFRQARKDSQDVLQSAATSALALALDRSGERDEARAVLAEGVRGDPRSFLRDPRVHESLAIAGAAAEEDALVGIALDLGDPAASRERWTAYATAVGARGTWFEHALTHTGAKKSAPRRQP